MHHFRYARLAPWSTRNRREHEHGQNNTLYVLFLSFGIPVSAPAMARPQLKMCNQI